MYELDLGKATAADIILRSAVCHPTLFRDQLRAVAAVHRRSAGEMRDRQARETASRMAQDCETIALFAEAGWLHMQRGLDLGEITFGQRIQAFSVAAKLSQNGQPCPTSRLSTKTSGDNFRFGMVSFPAFSIFSLFGVK